VDCQGSNQRWSLDFLSDAFSEAGSGGGLALDVADAEMTR
jgi:hypothetical protein